MRLLIITIILACHTALAQDVRSVHIYGGRAPQLRYRLGVPVVVSSHDYIALLDGERKAPVWVAYTIAIGHSAPPRRRFISRYPDVSLESGDYTNTGYDRGHLIARRLVDASPFMGDVDDMSVVAAMAPELNQGPWAALERSVEKEAIDTRDKGYVMAGAIWGDDPIILDDGEIPEAFWMVVTFTRDRHARQRCYIMRQDVTRHTDYETLRVKLSDVERVAHLSID